MDCTKPWLAFISGEIIHECIEYCVRECPACRYGILSPLLHRHNQLNLRGKMEQYYDRVVQQMNMGSLFDRFIIQFGWFSLQRAEYILIGDNFIKLSTPEAIFFGKYITYENDAALYGFVTTSPTQSIYLPESPKPVKEKPIKTKRRKKNITSQNDLLGAGAPDC